MRFKRAIILPLTLALTACSEALPRVNLSGETVGAITLFACNGECPKNRFCQTADGEPGLNYLCEGYRMFFAHVAPYMDFMKRELLAGRAPANVMKERF